MKMHWRKTLCLNCFVTAVPTCTFILYPVGCFPFAPPPRYELTLLLHFWCPVEHCCYSMVSTLALSWSYYKWEFSRRSRYSQRIVANSGSLQSFSPLVCAIEILQRMVLQTLIFEYSLSTVFPLIVFIDSIWASQLLLPG